MRKMKKNVFFMLLLLAVCVFSVSTASAATSSISRNIANTVVTLTPATDIYSGTSKQVQAEIKDGARILNPDNDYAINDSNMVEAGQYIVQINGRGNYTGIKCAFFLIEPVNINKAAIRLSRDFTTSDLSEDKTAIKEEILEKNVFIYQGEYNITNWCDIKSDINGNVLRITATISSGDGRNVISGSISYEYVLKISMDDCVIDPVDSVIYSGEAYKPAVKVKNSVTGAVLREGKEYELEYVHNTDAGIALIAVKGINNYAGRKNTYFVIEPKDIFTCNAYYTNGRASSAYTGKGIVPLVTVRDGYSKVLTAANDYIISYADENGTPMPFICDSGRYSIILNGTGNYTGQMRLEFEVVGTNISNYTITLRESRVKADGAAKIPEVISVGLRNVAVLEENAYDISYRDAEGNTVDEMVSPGKYYVIATGKKSCTGVTAAIYEIVGAEQEIIVFETSYKKYAKSASFKLSPSCTGDSTGYTYVSSNPEVASVSSDGVVSVHKLGRARITITTVGSKRYQKASKDIYVKVYPYKVVQTQKPWTNGAKKSFRVRWETQDDVTYYQVRYSTTKDFKTYKTKKVTQNTKGYKTQSTTISNLKSGQKYYVKVRAVKTVKNDYGETLYYYGNWSGWKSVTVK